MCHPCEAEWHLDRGWFSYCLLDPQAPRICCATARLVSASPTSPQRHHRPPDAARGAPNPKAGHTPRVTRDSPRGGNHRGGPTTYRADGCVGTHGATNSPYSRRTRQCSQV
jgi:hypothetical protein